MTITPATPGKPRIKREVMMDGEELVRVLRLHACLRGDDANVSCCAASGDDAGRRSNAQVVCSSKVDTMCFHYDCLADATTCKPCRMGSVTLG